MTMAPRNDRVLPPLDVSARPNYYMAPDGLTEQQMSQSGAAGDAC